MAHLSHHAETKPLWMIKPCKASEHRDKLMGRVVMFPDLPMERYIPYETTKSPREILPSLDPEPVEVRNMKFWTKRIRDTNVSSKLNDMIDFFVQQAKEQNSERIATVARAWHMDAPRDKFKALLKNAPYFKELQKLLLENHDTGYFVTDIVTLVNLEMTDESGRTTGAGANGTVIANPAPAPVSAGAGARASVKREQGTSFTYDEEMVVFLGYRKIRLEKVKGLGFKAKLRRFFRIQKYVSSIYVEGDYWPELHWRPVPGNAEGYLGNKDGPGPDRTPSPEDDEAEESKQLMRRESEDEYDAICTQLGCDMEIVG